MTYLTLIKYILDLGPDILIQEAKIDVYPYKYNNKYEYKNLIVSDANTDPNNQCFLEIRKEGVK